MWALYLEELKAALRGRFAWLGAGVVFAAVGAAATIGTQDTWLDGYGVIAYFLVPLTFIPFAAGAVASPRANRFVESLFTTPVSRRAWFAAKLLVLFTLAAAYYAALLPMMFVYIAHVGVPLLLPKFLLWAAALLVASIVIGALVGVLFIGRSIAAPAATGMGLVLAYAGFVPLQELMVARGNGATAVGMVTLVSPAVLLKNALGFTVAAGNLPETTRLTWICLAAMIGGAAWLAVWVFLHAQSVETWEATPRQRAIIAASLAALVLLPLAIADRNYERPAPPVTNAPSIRALFARGSGSLALTERGARQPTRCCDTILNRDAAPLATGEPARRDLLVLLPVDTSERIANLHVDVTGDHGLVVTIDAPPSLDWRLETRSYAAGLGPTDRSGRRIATGWVARLPITLMPTRPWDIGGLRYPLDLRATFDLDGDERAQVLVSRAAVQAEVASAVYEMSAASILVPILCFAGAFFRWRRTR